MRRLSFLLIAALAVLAGPGPASAASTGPTLKDAPCSLEGFGGGPAPARQPIAAGLTQWNLVVVCPAYQPTADHALQTTAHIVEVALATPGVSIHASVPQDADSCTTGKKSQKPIDCTFKPSLPSAVVSADIPPPPGPPPQIAINANLFVTCCSTAAQPAPTKLRGLEVEKGQTYSAILNNPEDTSPKSKATYASSLLVDQFGTASILTLSAGDPVPPGVATAVTGSHLIVQGGQNQITACSVADTCNSWLGPNARTAVGLKDPSTLLIVVVDGKDGGNAGVTLFQIGDIMQKLGTQNAINLDGGGSSAMMQRASPFGYIKLSTLADSPSGSQPCTVPSGARADCERYVGTVMTVDALPLP